MSQKVTMIAPVPPFRGGIAHHSAALAGGLGTIPECELEIESFQRLYPAFFYPGESPYDGTDPSSPARAGRFDLDVLNPLTWRTLARRIADRSDVAVIPCWTFFAAPCLGWIARQLRKTGVEVVMLVHNVGDHEGAAWKNYLTHWQLAGADRFVTHTPQLASQLRAAGLNQPCTIVPHPPYSDFPPATGSMPQEKALELLCFGLVRPYKGVDIALAGLAEADLPDVRLTIAGEIWDGEDNLRRLANDPRLAGKVEFRNSYQSDQDAADLFSRADALLLPYRTITGSGVLAMAQHYRLPVVASDLPALEQPIERDKLGWCFETGDAAELAQLLKSEISRENCAALASEMAEPDVTGWNHMASAVLDLP
ncbi:glycosyltransferase [Aurantiacibacter sp. MUD61]|uniref:glycosyltransferase n=1 Tax=Aurantiacibacter sp. MUD61 TaxID=3009083 RepID=UPI0022F11B63|nr:glycosyltransferase [Aurantiacibacter sp. MUD61]